MKPKTNEAPGVTVMVLAFLAWQISSASGITAFALFFIGAPLFYTERARRCASDPPVVQAPPAPRERYSFLTFYLPVFSQSAIALS